MAMQHSPYARFISTSALCRVAAWASPAAQTAEMYSALDGLTPVEFADKVNAGLTLFVA